MKATIKNKKEIAKETLLVEFDLIYNKVDFQPGQFFFVTLPGSLTHHFTIVNSPTHNRELSLATRIRETPFKKKLVKMEVGSDVDVGKIEGEFILPEDTSKPIIFIALGIGITPYISMLRFIKDKSLTYKISLIYSDSDKESMPFLTELKRMTQKNSDFKLIQTVTSDISWKGEKRHIDGQFIKDYLSNPLEDLYFISGPPYAVDSVFQSMIITGIEKNNIKTENFSGY